MGYTSIWEIVQNRMVVAWLRLFTLLIFISAGDCGITLLV